MKDLRFVALGLCLFLFLGILGCASDKPALQMVLEPPPNTPPQVQTYLIEGNRLFSEERWEEAKQQFQAALQVRPDMAEAHYNLALAMDHMGDEAGARRHFIKAKQQQNLFDCEPAIWVSPPLRRYGNVPDKPVGAASTPVLPGIGFDHVSSGPGKLETGERFSTGRLAIGKRISPGCYRLVPD